MTKTEIGILLRERRNFLDITQKELSEIVGIGLRSLVDIELGKGNPTIDQLHKITEALGLTIDVKVKSNE